MNLIAERGKDQEYVNRDTGERFFSVSQIRTMAYDTFAHANPADLEAAQKRGILVHGFLWRYLAYRQGLLDLPAITPAIEGYCRSFQRWADHHEVEPILLEHTGVNERHGYAGTLDILAWVGSGKKRKIMLIDGKSGVPTKTDKMQLALYEQLGGLGKIHQSLDLYLQADGKDAEAVFLTAQERVSEWAWAMSALGVLKGRLAHNCR